MLGKINIAEKQLQNSCLLQTYKFYQYIDCFYFRKSSCKKIQWGEIKDNVSLYIVLKQSISFVYLQVIPMGGTCSKIPHKLLINLF